MKTFLALAATTAVLALAGQASAAEFVANGGFEQGLTGWTQVGPNPDGFTEVTGGGVQHTGDLAFEEGNYPATGAGGVTQTLNTVAGGAYQITLFLATSNANDVNDQALQVLWNGVDVAHIFGAGEHDYFEYLWNVTGVGHDTLTVQGYAQHGFNYVDDISVTGAATGPVGPPNDGVPEPATWALMLTGFFGLGSALRRRRGLALTA